MASRPVAALLELDGEIIERQSYLNGTLYLLIEAAGDGWNVQLALTLPREQGEALNEGDVTLSAGDRAWYGLAAGGAHRHAWDDDVDAPVLDIRARFTCNAEAESSEAWPAIEVDARLRGDEARLTITTEPG